MIRRLFASAACGLALGALIAAPSDAAQVQLQILKGITWQAVTADASGYIQTDCVVGCAGGAASNASDAQATSSTNGQTLSFLMGYNGASWDRLRDDGSFNLQVVEKNSAAVLTAVQGAIPACAASPCVTTIGNTGPAAMTPAAGTASSITTGGTSQIAVTGPVRGCYIVNPAAATEALGVDPTGGTANATTATGTSALLAAGQTFNCIPGQTTNVTVNATTTSHVYVVVRW